MHYGGYIIVSDFNVHRDDHSIQDRKSGIFWIEDMHQERTIQNMNSLEYIGTVLA